MTRVKILCPTCDGTCAEVVAGVIIECRDCDGRGRVWVDRPDQRGQWLILAAIAVLALFALVMIIAAPRRAPDPTAPSPASDVAGLALASTTSAASSSGPGPFGAPPVSDRLAATAPGGAPRQLSAAPIFQESFLPDTATAEVHGTATWLCDPPRWTRCTHGYGENSLVAAAGSEIKAWRGRMVRVWSGGHHVDVRLVDACGCKGSRVIDLYAIAFRKLAPQGAGEIFVTVELLGGNRGIALPPTDTVR